MNLSKTTTAGVLGLMGLLAYLVTTRLPGADAPTLVGLAGVVIGSTITASIQVISSRSDKEDRYRLAAIERRLQAHQEAFALWKDLTANLNPESKKLGLLIVACQDWYNKNCLYLEKDAGEKFRIAYISAGMHYHLIKSHAETNVLEENFKDIWRVGDALRSAVALPAIGTNERDLAIEHEPREA